MSCLDKCVTEPGRKALHHSSALRSVTPQQPYISGGFTMNQHAAHPPLFHQVLLQMCLLLISVMDWSV